MGKELQLCREGMGGVADRMKLAIAFGNCQVQGIAHFLRKANFPYEIRTFENFRFILKEQDPAEFKELARHADLFIYQPTDAKYDDLCAQRIVDNVLKPSCKTISFPYIFNHGYLPLAAHGNDIFGEEYIRALLDAGITKANILDRYKAGTIDFGMVPRFFACIAEQARREVFTDIKIARWMVNHRHKQLMLSYNHPSSEVFVELAFRVIEAVDEGDALFRWDGPNDVGLPCSMPLSRYAIKTWGMDAQPDMAPQLDSEKCYLDLLLAVFMRYANEA